MSQLCPHCHDPITLPASESVPQQLVCKSCGELFQRGTGDTVTFIRDGSDDTVTYVPVSRPLPTAAGGNEKDFGGYELLNEIARGGMGVVVKARHRKLNRIVALKLIRSGELADDEEIKRFHSEAEAAAKLDHPNIVPIYEVGEHDGQSFFSMGFVDGESLSGRLKDGPLDPMVAAEFVKVISEAVQYAHDRGIIHRDLKPANVLVDQDGRPKVTDFGLAKNTTADSGLTTTGQVMGTPSYMPPEQAVGKIEAIGPLADVYSLGAMLYALLTGRPPFQSANVIETLNQVVHQEPVPPRTLNPAIGRDLETVCLKCLEKDPGKRYESAQALSDELDRILTNRPITARPVGRIERSVRWCRRNPVGSALIGMLVVLAIGGPIVAINQMRLSNLAREEKDRADEKVVELAQANSELKVALAAESAAKRLAKANEKRAKEKERIAERNLETAIEVVQSFVLEIGKDGGVLSRYPGTQKLRKKLLLWGREYFERLRETNQSKRLVGPIALSEYHLAIIHSQLSGDKQKSLAAYQKSAAAIEELLKDNPDSNEFRDALAVNLNNMGALLQDLDQPKKALATYQKALELRQTLAERNPDSATYKSEVAASLNNIGVIQLSLAQTTQAMESFEKAKAICVIASQAIPDDPTLQSTFARVHNNIGLLHRDLGQWTEALRAHQKALALWKALTTKNQTEVQFAIAEGESYSNLAACFLAKNDVVKALGVTRESVAFFTKLAQRNPHVLDYQVAMARNLFGLGRLLRTAGQPAEALTYYQKSATLLARLHEENPKFAQLQVDLANSLNSVGLAQQDIGRHASALLTFRRAITVLESQSDDSSNTAVRDVLARTHYNTGRHLRMIEKSTEARPHYEKAIKIRKQLIADNPAIPDHRVELAKIWNDLGILEKSSGQMEQAVASHQKAVAIYQKLVSEHKVSWKYQSLLAEAVNNVGVANVDRGKVKESLKSYGKAIAITERLSQAQPSIPKYRDQLARALGNSGVAYDRLGKQSEALKAYQRAIGIREKLIKEVPTSILFRKELGSCLSNLAYLCSQTDQYKMGVSACTRAATVYTLLLQIAPNSTEFLFRQTNARYIEGILHARAHKPKEAIAAYKRALPGWRRLLKNNPSAAPLQSRFSRSLNDIAYYSLKLDLPEQAIRHVDEALPIAETLRKKFSKSPSARNDLKNVRANRALALEALYRFAEAAEEWKNVLALDDGRYRAFYTLRRAHTLAKSGDYREAVRVATPLKAARLPVAVFELSRVYSCAATAANRDSKLSPQDRSRIVQGFQSQALQILKKLGETGYLKVMKNRSILASDSDFDSLRNLESFQDFCRTHGIRSPVVALKPR